MQLRNIGEKIRRFVFKKFVKTCRELDNRSERKAGDVFHRAMLTVMLVRCMKKYGYFGPDANDEIMTDDECYIGFVLNHFLEVNQFNAHEVAQVCIFLGLIGVLMIFISSTTTVCNKFNS